MYTLKVKDIGDNAVITGVDRRPLDPVATEKAAAIALEKTNTYREYQDAQSAFFQVRPPAKNASGRYVEADWVRWVDEKGKTRLALEEKSAELIVLKKELFNLNKKYAPLRRGEVEHTEELAEKFKALKATESLTSKGEVLPEPIVVLEVEDVKGKMTPEDKKEMRTRLIENAEEQAVRRRMLLEIKGTNPEDAIKDAKAFLDEKVAQIESQFTS